MHVLCAFLFMLGNTFNFDTLEVAVGSLANPRVKVSFIRRF